MYQGYERRKNRKSSCTSQLLPRFRTSVYVGTKTSQPHTKHIILVIVVFVNWDTSIRQYFAPQPLPPFGHHPLLSFFMSSDDEVQVVVPRGMPRRTLSAGRQRSSSSATPAMLTYHQLDTGICITYQMCGQWWGCLPTYLRYVYKYRS